MYNVYGHDVRQVCGLLLAEGIDPDEFAERMTALDVAEAHCHPNVSSLLRRSHARRFMERKPLRRWKSNQNVIQI